jgi:PAS domain S-box-containing protein
MPRPAKARHGKTPALRAAESRIQRYQQEADPFAAAVEATRMPMVVTDPRLPEDPIIFANDSFLALTGYAREEVLGRHLYFLAGPETDRNVLGAFQEAVRENREATFELLHRRKDGRPIWCAVFVSPVIDEQGRIVYHFASYLNVTERHRLEEQLRRTNEELEARVRDRALRLEEANRRLQEEVIARQGLLEEKEALLRELTHRVTNTLQLSSSLLALQAGEVGDAGAQALFREAQDRFEALAKIHRLLYQSSDLRRIDFAEYARELCHGLISSLEIDPGRVRVEVAGEGVVCEADRTVPLALVLNELVSNALRHAFPDGREGEIRVELTRSANGRARLTVSDNGVGLPEDAARGACLGFRLVRALAAQAGGEVEIGSGGRGTKIAVAFPAEERAAAAKGRGDDARARENGVS